MRGQFTLQIEAASPRQSDIEHHASGRIQQFAAQEVPRRFESFDAQTDRHDKTSDGLPNRRIIIDHEDERLSRFHGAPFPEIGRVN
jgi:hypothetical protein